MATIEQFTAQYPRLFHMAEHGSWPSIQKHGLLSTTALLDLFEILGTERFKIESEWRRDSISIKHPSYGTATIRDQRPMPPDSLKKVLEDSTPQQWYELLNGKSFFWPTKERLMRLLNAKLYRNRSHDVIIVDTKSLLERHIDNVTLSPINSGFSLFGKGKRSLKTFKSVEEYPPITNCNDVVELAVEYCVKDVAYLVVSVEQRRGDTLLKKII